MTKMRGKWQRAEKRAGEEDTSCTGWEQEKLVQSLFTAGDPETGRGGKEWEDRERRAGEEKKDRGQRVRDQKQQRQTLTPPWRDNDITRGNKQINERETGRERQRRSERARVTVREKEAGAQMRCTHIIQLEKGRSYFKTGVPGSKCTCIFLYLLM